LIQDPAGNLYGTTAGGGTAGQGTVFRLAADGSAFTTLHEFNGTDGASPHGALIQDPAGNVYGTTTGGGAFGQGTVFQLAADGSTFIILHEFNGTDGASPHGALIQDPAGNLYGTTAGGGTAGQGTVFRLAADGSAFTTLHEFNGTDGASPHGALIQDPAGNLYGTTAGGGAAGQGTVFRLAGDGSTFATLHEFNGADGAIPVAGLVQAPDGNLFGTTSAGGADASGVVFRLRILPIDTVIDSAPSDPANGATATFLFRSSEAELGFECQLDGSGFGPCASPMTYDALLDGPHTFEVRAISALGDPDPTPATHSWVVDTTAPDAVIEGAPPSPTNSTDATFTFRSASATATFECQLDGGGFVACTSPKAYSGLAEGTHAFLVRATDPAGNTGATTSHSWTVDTTAPDTLIDSSPPGTTTSGSAAFTFHATEAGSTFACQLDGGGFAACTGTKTYSGLLNGSHVFQVRATDPAGNTAASPRTYAWTVQALPPDLMVSALTAPSVSGAGQTITVTDTTRNQGTGASGPSMTLLHLSSNTTVDAGDAQLGSRTVGGLSPGEVSTGSTVVTIPAGTVSGTYYLIAVADAANNNQESKETNNTRTVTIKILPDLVVTALSAPATVSEGGTITLTDTTKNQAGVSPAEASTTWFYLSIDATLSADDVVLGSRAIPALAAGAASTGATAVTIPPGTASGTYYVIAVADGDRAQTETLETNNTRTDTIKVIGPDLIVSALGVPSSAGTGTAIIVGDTTKNLAGVGPAAASTTWFYLSTDAILSADDVLLGSRAIPPLAPGTSSAGTTTVTIPIETLSGTFYVIAVADGDSTKKETVETNNTRATTIKIMRPDLTVSALTTSTSAAPGAAIAVKDTTKNLSGTGPAGPSTTWFYLSSDLTVSPDDAPLGSRAVPPLAASASSAGTTTVTIPQETTPGTYYVIAVADADRTYPEHGETNNTRTATIAVKSVSTSTNYLGWISPDASSQIASAYKRSQDDFAISGLYTFEAKIKFAAAPTPQVRIKIDGSPVSAWLDPPYRVTVDTTTLAEGSHLLSAEVTDSTVVPTDQAFRVVNAGGRGDAQPIWVFPGSYDYSYGTMSMGSGVVQYPGSPVVVTDPTPPFSVVPYNTLMPANQLWSVKMGTTVDRGFVRRFNSTPDGGVTVAPHQFYFWADRGGVRVPMMDGPRGTHALAHVTSGRVHPQGYGFYGLETNGRLLFIGLDGTVTTLAGWRIKPGRLVPYHGAHESPDPGAAAWYMEQWESVGNWLDGPGTLSEPWDVLAYPSADSPTGYHEFIITDTLHHRLVYADHRPAHEPGGATVLRTLGGRTDAVPSFCFHEPWGIDRSPVDGKIYWTNNTTGDICRANLDGTDVERIAYSATVPTDADLGVTFRGSTSTYTTSAIRAAFLKDGELGTALIVRPMHLRFTSTGKLRWVERYTYAIRELDLATNAITTVALVPDTEDAREITLYIDTEGSVGPVDDMFTAAWKQGGDHRWSESGVDRGHFFAPGGDTTKPLIAGPLHQVKTPGYPWVLVPGQGMVWWFSTAADGAGVVVKRPAGSPDADLTTYKAGRAVYEFAASPSFALTHGETGQGHLGRPTFVQMNLWTDAELDAYWQDECARATSCAPLTATQLSYLRYFVRWNGEQ
jgi:uncharacterized repeat protein (TIGR03803 family)